MKTLKSLYYFIKSEAVLCIAGFIAVISMFFTPPSVEYLSYIDFRVLALLFCLMAVVAGFNKTGLFILLSEKLLHRTKNTRSLSYVLIMLCFFTSMWITNDVALITFVPFAILLLTMTKQMKLLIFVIVMQTIAANLGSMLTPVGNPQNLYLYSYYNIPIKDFLLITLPITFVSFLLLSVSVLLIRKEPLTLVKMIKDTAKPQKKSSSYLIALYGFLFLICLFSVLRFIDYRITLAIVLLGIIVFDRTIVKKIDYALLLTFICFFVFVGNFGNISVINDFLARLLKGKEIVISVLVSQGISNVPAAVLLSAFTDNWKALVLGTNVGGLGTLVASLASLISYKLYCKSAESRPGKYLAVFTIYNIIFLIVIGLLLMFLS